MGNCKRVHSSEIASIFVAVCVSRYNLDSSGILKASATFVMRLAMRSIIPDVRDLSTSIAMMRIESDGRCWSGSSY